VDQANPVWISFTPSIMDRPWIERCQSSMHYARRAPARLLTAKPWGSNIVLVQGKLQRYRAGEGRAKSGIKD
jgi:hypothetical protein